MFLPDEWAVEKELTFGGIRPDVLALHPERGVVVVKVAVLDVDFGFEKIDSDLRTLLDLTRSGQNSEEPEVTQWEGSPDPRYELAEWARELDRLMADVSEADMWRLLRAVLLLVQPSSGKDRADVLDAVPWDCRGDRDLSWLEDVPSNVEDMAGLVTEMVPQAFTDGPALPPSTWSRLKRDVLGTEDSVLGLEPPIGFSFDRKQIAVLDHLANPGLKRIRGAAGSGKSTILAKVVADRVRAGDSVLLVVRNKSMCQIIRTRALHFMNRDTPDAGERSANLRRLNEFAFVVWQERWWKRVCVETGLDGARRAIYKSSRRNDLQTEKDVIELVAKGLASERGAVNPNLRWDLVIADEAQNMLIDNWRCLRSCMREDGTAVVSADPTQSLYGPRPWTEAGMEGFRDNPWRTLNTTHRLPDDYTDFVLEFLDRFPTSDEVVLPAPPAQREFSRTSLFRIASRTEFQRDGIVRAVRFALVDLGFLPHQIAFLVPTNERGRVVVRDLSAVGINVTHTFNEDLRLDFGLTDGVRGATYHSYAGWESPCVIVDLKFNLRQANANANDLLFSGLTRLAKRDLGSALIVVEADNRFLEFMTERCERIVDAMDEP